MNFSNKNIEIKNKNNIKNEVKYFTWLIGINIIILLKNLSNSIYKSRSIFISCTNNFFNYSLYFRAYIMFFINIALKWFIKVNKILTLENVKFQILYGFVINYMGALLYQWDLIFLSI